MKFAGTVLLLLCCILCMADMAVTIKGVEFRDPVLTPTDDGKVKITTVYGEKTVDYSDLDPIDIRAKKRLYTGYKLESIAKERISLSHDGITIRIKLEDLDDEYRPMFGLAVAEKAVVEAAPKEEPQEEAPPPAKSDFFLAGEVFRAELIHAMENFTPPAAPASAVATNLPGRSNRPVVSSGSIMKNIVFIVDEGKGAGSGTLCNLWGIPVIITNAHVYMTAEKPTILDGMRNEYKPKAVLVSPIRDIAILKIDLPPNATPLELNYQVENLPVNAYLTAYGNSLGHDVATQLEGVLKGIGPTQIEISAPIVPGNSGGPVICNNRVIGISTSARLVRDDIWMTDSPYEGQYKNINRNLAQKRPVIRRFATRLDNLQPGRLEVFANDMQFNDLKFYRDLSRAFNVFISEVKKNRNPLAPEAIANRIYAPFGEFYAYRSHVEYINKMLENEIELQNKIFSLLEISLNYSNAVERRNAGSFFQKILRYRKGYYDCLVCTGRGQKPNSSIGLAADRETGSSVSCVDCQGVGRYIGTFYDVPRGFSPGVMAVSKETLGGMRTGWSRDMLKSALRNDDHWSVMEFAGAVVRVSFERNPVVPSARQSTAIFTMDKLAEIALVFDYSANLLEDIESGMTGQFGPPTYKLEKDELVKMIFKKGDQTVDIFWSSLAAEQGVTVRLYNNVLFGLKQLLINDMGSTPYITGRGREFEINNQQKPATGRGGLGTGGQQQQQTRPRNYNIR